MNLEQTQQKSLYIIAGCNGAGKTTASFTVLPKILDCKEFVNADEIAKGISPFNPSSVATTAGKIMLKRIKELLAKNETFSIETTLASKLFTKTIKTAQDNGYLTTLLFFWLQSVETAKNRVAQRVKSGGHNIENDVIERRYLGGIKNLFELYIPIVDKLYIYDNTDGISECIAKKMSKTGEVIVVNREKHNLLEAYYDTNK
ncbi:MAG: zeta toxin family protein [Chitinivibrionia bacterium]|nr:zeta toxin family protein [Chitinivibrionia bacterium]